MSDPIATSDPALICVTDVGSTTTKAVLFERSLGADREAWTMRRREAATTVERPDEDVTIGVRRALAAIEAESQRERPPEAERLVLLRDDRPAVPYFSTSSAGGGLAVAVTGLVRAITSRSAERVALGAGAIVLDILAIDDGRTPYQKIRELERLRPDLVLLAGGFDGEAISGPVFLAELLQQANLHPKRNPKAKLPVIFAGNRHAFPYVRETLGERFLLRAVDNLRPAATRERLGPARDAIHELFMEHVMSQAPGYPRLQEWVDGPLLPTPSAFGRILALVSRASGERILAVDVGGATTDVFTARHGEVQRTVSANLGMSYSILQVLRTAGFPALRSLLDPALDADDILNRIGDKHLHPTRLPRDAADAEIERAIATLAVREAVRAHLHVLSGKSDDRGEEEFRFRSPLRREDASGAGRREDGRAEVSPPGYDLVIGSGGALSHVPRETAARILTDALHLPRRTALAVDRAFVFPHLGVLSAAHPTLAVRLFHELGLVRLGSAAGDDRVPDPVHPGPLHPVPARRDEAIRRGEIRLARELSIPGEVFVRPGREVDGDTVIARSTRVFLRPFFLPVASVLEVPPEEAAHCLLKSPGETVRVDELVARRKGRLRAKEYHSTVSGLIEKLLPDGTLLVRENADQARQVVTVPAADEMRIDPRKLAPFLRCQVGQEVEAGQVLAGPPPPSPAPPPPPRAGAPAARAPIRGRVAAIQIEDGTIRIEPLREELEVRAWIPGMVEEVTDRGAVISNSGVEIQGAWGCGGETAGVLEFDDEVAESASDRAGGAVVYRDHLSAGELERLQAARVRGVVAAGADLAPLLDAVWPFTVVLIEGFGVHPLDDGTAAILEAARGRKVYLDGTTELRVGVRRPRLFVLDPASTPGDPPRARVLSSGRLA